MSDSVLGRDPFSRPAAPMPEAQQAPGAPAKAERKRAAKPIPKARPAKPAKAARPSLKPASEAPTKPLRLTPQEELPIDEEKTIDRRELLDEAAEAEGSLHGLLGASARLACPATYARKLGEVGLRFRAEEVDPFGFDPVYWKKVEPFFDFLFESYWRVEVRGLENIPGQGRVLLVGNHSGTLPYDGAMLKLAVEKKHPAGRPLRFLVEDFVFHFPFLGAFINRIGGVRANPDNARRLLENEQLVAVFPEGIKGIGKLFRDRYKLQRFGRGGFMKLALRTGSPIVPVAVVGAEEIHPMLARMFWLARPLGLPYFPITPTFPILGPLGAVPLPSKWLIEFGKPMDLEGTSPADAEDPLKVTALSERVRETIQHLVNNLLEARPHPFLG